MKDGIFRILAIGDIVGKCGSEFLRKELGNIKSTFDIDFTVVNGENSAVGNGITKDSADNIFSAGADVITTGNHVFRRNEIYTYLDDAENIIRPANYPGVCPGNGYCITRSCGMDILTMNVLGTMYMESMEDPFSAAEKILTAEKGKYDIALCDIHAEATSEKAAFAIYFDGRLDAVFGTHTHVQTNDARVLKNGTGFITDLGMTGPYDSVIGVKSENVIKKFTTKMPVRFDEADGRAILCGAVFEYDTKQKKTVGAFAFNKLQN